MTDEQKIVTVFRSRDEQLDELADKFAEGHSIFSRAPMALNHIREAEARGAAEQRRKDVEGGKAVGGWMFLTGNMSEDPRLPSCRLSRLFQEGDTFPRFKQAADEFGIEVILKSEEREEEDWDKELSADLVSRLDQYEHLIAEGWSFVDVWDDEHGNIVRLFARPIRASLHREGSAK